MKCPTCGTDNPDTAKYCAECGHPLARKAAAVAVHRGEDLRKVTVVFSDLSGYTAMSEKLGPEATKEITTRIFSEAASIASKFDGRLDRLVGDCALILFRIPRLHEVIRKKIGLEATWQRIPTDGASIAAAIVNENLG